MNDIQFIQNKATSGLSLILDTAIECLHKDSSMNPRGLYNLTQTIIACSRNLPAIAESDEDDHERGVNYYRRVHLKYSKLDLKLTF